MSGYRVVPPPFRLRGRESAQRVLAVTLADARSEHGGALLVSSAPGLGKTALVEHTCATASDFRVLRASGVRSESDFAFAGLQQLLRPVASHLDGLSEPQATALREALETGQIPESERFALSTGFRDLLSLLARESPLLCCVDDAQLLDGASLEVLAFAARRLADAPIAMVFAAREVHPKPLIPGVAALSLSPLDETAIQDVLDDLVGGRIAPHVRARLVTAAQGNPQAVHGFAHALTDEQLSGISPLPCPLPLDERLCAELTPPYRELPSDTRTLLLLAAADPDASVDDITRAAAPGVPVSALEPAEERGLVRAMGNRLRFAVPLMREAIYQTAPLARRRDTHGLLARVIDPRHEPSRYARHRFAAAGGPDIELASEIAGAVTNARTLEGHTAASEGLERAAELTPVSGRRACRLLAAAHDAWLAGQLSRSTALLDRARPIATTEGTAGTIELLQGHLGLRDGNALDAAESLLTAAERLAPRDRALGARALQRAADAGSFAGDPVRHARATERLAALTREDDPPALRLASSYLAGCTASFAGDYAASLPPLRRVIDLAGRIDEPSELVWASIAALRLGDTSRAHALATRARDVAERRGAVSAIPHALEFLVYAEFWTGRFPAAAGNCLRGLRLARDTRQGNCATHLLAALSLIAAIQGDADACRARASAVTEHAGVNSLGLPAALSTWALAVLELANGDAPNAFSRLRILAHAGPGHGHPTMRLLTAPYFVESAVRTGEVSRARRVLDGYERWAHTTGSRGALALAARSRGLLAPPEAAPDHFQEALRLHRENGEDDIEHARTALLYGTMLRRNRLPGRSREHLRAALDTFERLGARLWVGQTRAELRAIGDLEQRPEPRVSEELTVQQRQIARLVAEGATNREVAAHMFVSPRTVEYHLRGIFRKLNIRSRVDLARIELGDDG